MSTDTKRLDLNDDTITGIAMVPAMRIVRGCAVSPPFMDFVIDQVKRAIAEGLRVANDQAEEDTTDA